jgi:hypothetical protein
VRHLDGRYLARPAPGYGEAAAGDHLQLGWAFWLPGHQLEHGAAPWADPYSFRPEAAASPNLPGWLLGAPFWPLRALFGNVWAYDLVVLLSFVAAGGLACWWLRALGLSRGAALAGGLVFALAPYRVGQSTGHLLGLISFLLPATLLALERRRFTWAGLALAAIPLSGQIHLAMGAVVLALGYAWARVPRPSWWKAGAAALAAAIAAVVVQQTVVEGSIAGGGRSFAQVRHYSAELSDLVTRSVGAGIEELVFVGWLTPLLAVAGLWAVRRERGLAVLLGLAALVPCLLALGSNLPLYEPLWHALPPLRYPRVPERLLPIACLSLAGLAAIAVDQLRGRTVAIVALVLVAVDLRAGVALYRPASADPDNREYAALAERGLGRLLELPVFIPERQYGSVYLYYSMQAPRERPGGYSSVAPRSGDRTARRLVPLNCGAWSPRLGRELEALGVRYVTVHRGLYADPAVPDCAARAARNLRRHGFRLLAADGPVLLYAG